MKSLLVLHKPFVRYIVLGLFMFMVVTVVIQGGLRTAISLQRAKLAVGESGGAASEPVSTKSFLEASVTRIAQQTTFLFPGDRFGYRMLGYSLLAEGQIEEAVDAWCHLPDISIELFHMGQQSRRSGRYADAAQWYALADAVQLGSVADLEKQYTLYYYKHLEEGVPSITELSTDFPSIFIALNDIDCEL